MVKIFSKAYLVVSQDNTPNKIINNSYFVNANDHKISIQKSSDRFRHWHLSTKKHTMQNSQPGGAKWKQVRKKSTPTISKTPCTPSTLKLTKKQITKAPGMFPPTAPILVGWRIRDQQCNSRHENEQQQE